MDNLCDSTRSSYSKLNLRNIKSIDDFQIKPRSIEGTRTMTVVNRGKYKWVSE